MAALLEGEGHHRLGIAQRHRLVQRHVVGQPATDEVDDRSADRLAVHVPAGDVERALGVVVTHQGFTHSSVDVGEVGRVAADQRRCQLVHRRYRAPSVCRKVRGSQRARLCPPVDPLVGDDPHDRARERFDDSPARHHIRAVAVSELVGVCLDRGDAHGRTVTTNGAGGAVRVGSLTPRNGACSAKRWRGPLRPHRGLVSGSRMTCCPRAASLVRRYWRQPAEPDPALVERLGSQHERRRRLSDVVVPVRSGHAFPV